MRGATGPTGSVISFTTAISAVGVSTFLQLLSDYMGEDGDYARVNYHIDVGRMITSKVATDPECLICGKNTARGDQGTPLPVRG